MDEPRLTGRIAVRDLVAGVEEGTAVASLRYFDRAGSFAQAVEGLLGAALPGTLEAQEVPQTQLILAWRAPTETLCFARSARQLEELGSRLPSSTEGCMVELTGGIRVVRLEGSRSADLLCRLGGTAPPEPGEARRGRLADVAVLALCVRAGETLLAVERVYLPHLLGWIRETLLDFA